MWIGGAGAAMWSPRPAVTPPATPTVGSPAVIFMHRWPRSRHRCERGWNANRRSDRLIRWSVRSSVTAWVIDTPERPWPRSWPGSQVGQRNRQLWESTRNLYNLVATGALDPSEVDQVLLAAAERCGLLEEEPRQTHRTLASGRQVGLAKPGRPRQPTSPARTQASRTQASLPLRAVGEPAKERG
jgi:hypothetical protein